MSALCPNGHSSASTDYCDTCGAPIASAAGAAAGAAPAAPGATALPSSSSKPCPNCATENLPDALFCESCGYDFTTGAMPRPLTPPSSLDLGAPAPPSSPSRSSSPAPDPAAAPAPDPAPVAPSVPLEWVAEVWVDPDWYALQEAEAPCPSPGLPSVVPLTERSMLVGRRSESRNIHPQLELGADIGVSRRHAQLTTDGQRWFVEDLQSANGTYVAQASAPLPSDPIAPGRREELEEDDRIYVGAWTRIVVRKATPEEKAGEG